MTLGEYDIAVIGSGIAGASLAAALPETTKVLLIEGEGMPGFHSTGRSAAIYSGIYGNATIMALSRASLAFLSNPPDGFADHPLTSSRGILFVARADQLASLHAMASQPLVQAATRLLAADEIASVFPHMRQGHAEGAIYEQNAFDLDVGGLQHGFLAKAKRCGVTRALAARVRAIEPERGGWRIDTEAGQFRASVVVNAAGAWADELALMAGASPCGVGGRRRTVVLTDIDNPAAVAGDAPMVVDIDERFYFKPESGGLLISPADETPVPPGDVQPEEIDIAIGIDRVMTATTLSVRRVRRSWAGLRNFTSDRTPVVGYDPGVDGFFWLAGQGGYGIQTAPALSRLAAALVGGKTPPADILDHGLDVASLSPSRFREPAPLTVAGR